MPLHPTWFSFPLGHAFLYLSVLLGSRRQTTFSLLCLNCNWRPPATDLWKGYVFRRKAPNEGMDEGDVTSNFGLHSGG
jgi:hypothetical protein